MRYLKIFLVLLICYTLSGCAHRIDINPDVSNINNITSSEKIPGNAGYYYPPGSREQLFTNPVGGGDSVKYYAYKDIEAAFSVMLGNVFGSVTRLDSISKNELLEKSINYIVSLDIKTKLSSGPFTWPPNWFVFDLSSQITNANGQHITTIYSSGEGRARYKEILSDNGIAGRRAANNALRKMQESMFTSEELRNIFINKPKDNNTEARLKNIEQLFKKELITKEEYDKKRKEIINNL